MRLLNTIPYTFMRSYVAIYKTFIMKMLLPYYRGHKTFFMSISGGCVVGW